MNRHFPLSTLISILFFLCSCHGEIEIENGHLLKSPSQNLSVGFQEDSSTLNLSLISQSTSQASPSCIINIDVGSMIRDIGNFSMEVEIKELIRSSHKETWQTVYGERKEIPDQYNQVKVFLVDKSNADSVLEIECRLYDEGLAFRYLFKGESFTDGVLRKESTYFSFEGNYETWTADRAQSAYILTTLSSIEIPVERPLVIKHNDTSYFAVGEAALVNYARAKFVTAEDKINTVQISLDGEVDLKKAGYVSPWRYVMVGNSPGNLLEHNYLVQNLNEANKIQDVSWIRPGKVIREVTLTTQGGKACVDFAEKHNMQYVEFDAGWYGNEYEESSDASTITVDPKRSPGPLDLHEVIAYGKKKNIGVILYVNRREMEKQLDQILPLYQSWGVAGVKYGFVNVGPQEWTIWLHEAVRKAAKYHLMVDIHDEYRPTGYSRTYPNLMTQEGIRGDEESPSISQSITTLFTRMLAGAGDNTNCYFAARVSDQMGGKAAQMAKAIMIYSPWQFLYWYDRPNGSPHKTGGAGNNQNIIREGADLGFYDRLPTTWDTTMVLESDMEDFATVVRKNGETWFMGSLAANNDRVLKVALDFLDPDSNYVATLYSQDKLGLHNNNVTIDKIKINNKSVLNRRLESESGLAIIIVPVKGGK